MDQLELNNLGNYITGTLGNDVLTGSEYDDTLDGGAGADIMAGGAGDDYYYVDNTGDRVIENANEGKDTVWSSVSYTLSENVENLALTGSEYGLSGTGNDLDNLIIGTSSYNILDGGKGADTMIGGDGMDFYSVDNAGDVIIENANEGRDLVYSSISYTLGDNVEDLVLGGMDYINGTGNDLDNYIIGNVAANVLIGGAGNDTLDARIGSEDTLIGGIGDDFYQIGGKGSVTDVIIENADEGFDTVLSSISYKLADNVENLVLEQMSGNINGTGSSLNNVITGNRDNNIIDGGIGADTMIGGAGNDTYYVDNVDDLVIEHANSIDIFGRIINEGTDIVYSSVSYTLSENVEDLTLTGSTAINGTGNSIDNYILGNSANNILTGGAGNDTLNGAAGADSLIGDTGNDFLYAGSGADTLCGGADNDILDGGVGADLMLGGIGDDKYYVDNTGDIVIENADSGIDAVNSSITYTLTENVENLTLTGSSVINGTGNDLDNYIIGNSVNNVLTGGAGNDTLDGGIGADTMIGGSGDDTYYVTNYIDIVKENADEGNDTIYSTVTYTLSSNVENLILTGTAAMNATGNNLSNVIIGNSAANNIGAGAGNDTLIGGAGNDSLKGGSDDDTYIFNLGDGNDTVNDSSSSFNDQIIFNPGVTKSDVAVFMSGTDLIVDYGKTIGQDKIVILGQAGYTAIEKFQLSDGTYISNTDVNQLIQTMTAYATANSIQLTSINDVKSNQDLMALVSNSWHN